MVGLGEERNEVLALNGRPCAPRTSIFSPSPVPAADPQAPRGRAHSVPPDEFNGLRDHRLCQGFLMVSASPLTALLAPCGRRLRTAQGRRATASRPDLLIAACLVIGSPGAGKSTLSARVLRQKLGVPVIISIGTTGCRMEIPRHGPRRAKSSERLPTRRNGSWTEISRETFDLRMPRADTLVWLDYPRSACVRRILTRTIKDYGKQKPDLPEGCPEQFDKKLRRWVWNFPAKQRPQIVAGHRTVRRALASHPHRERSRRRGLSLATVETA